MPWTNPRTWTAGETVTASVMNAHIRDNLKALNGYVRKTADESVTSSATLQDDNDLFYAISATGDYIFDLFLYALSATNAAGDLQIGFSYPTGTLYVGTHGLDITLASGQNGTVYAAAAAPASGAQAAVVGLSTGLLMIHVHGLLVATATGTLQTMWAQQASNANASTIKAGSHLLVKQVA